MTSLYISVEIKLRHFLFLINRLNLCDLNFFFFGWHSLSNNLIPCSRWFLRPVLFVRPWIPSWHTLHQDRLIYLLITEGFRRILVAQIAVKPLLIVKFFPISEQRHNIEVSFCVKVFEFKQAFNDLTVVKLWLMQLLEVRIGFDWIAYHEMSLLCWFFYFRTFKLIGFFLDQYIDWFWFCSQKIFISTLQKGTIQIIITLLVTKRNRLLLPNILRTLQRHLSLH